jgi:translation initiation factor 1
MKERKRISTDGEPIAWASPFATLRNAGLPLAPEVQPEAAPHNTVPLARKKNRGRVDIIRQTAHRGGKTVTVVTGFTGIGLAEKETLAKEMQKACGAGGTVKDPDQCWFSTGAGWRVTLGREAGGTGEMDEGSRSEVRGFRNFEPRTSNIRLRIAHASVG